MIVNSGTEILDKWVSPDGDAEVTLTYYEGDYAVTTHLVEVPEEGEEIPEGEELMDSISNTRTKSPERARTLFLKAIRVFQG